MLEQYAEFLEPYCAGKWHTWVRFGKWQDILKCPLPGGEVDWTPEEDEGEKGAKKEGAGGSAKEEKEGVDEPVEKAAKKGPKKLELGASFWRTCRATAYYSKGVAFAALGDVKAAEDMQAKFLSAKAVVSCVQITEM